MVGGGFLRPEPTNSRKDTPKAFKQLLVRCCQFNAEDRPFFHQVSAPLLWVAMWVWFEVPVARSLVVLLPCSCHGQFAATFQRELDTNIINPEVICNCQFTVLSSLALCQIRDYITLSSPSPNTR